MVQSFLSAWMVRPSRSQFQALPASHSMPKLPILLGCLDAPNQHICFAAGGAWASLSIIPHCLFPIAALWQQIVISPRTSRYHAFVPFYNAVRYLVSSFQEINSLASDAKNKSIRQQSEEENSQNECMILACRLVWHNPQILLNDCI